MQSTNVIFGGRVVAWKLQVRLVLRSPSGMDVAGYDGRSRTRVARLIPLALASRKIGPDSRAMWQTC